MAKRFRHGEIALAERMRLEEKMRPFLIYAVDEDGEEDVDNVIGLREDAPEDVKNYYARTVWEAGEVARTGDIVE